MLRKEIEKEIMNSKMDAFLSMKMIDGKGYLPVAEVVRMLEAILGLL